MKYRIFPCMNGVFAVTNNKKIIVSVKKSGKINILENLEKIKFSSKIFFIRGFLFLIFGIYYSFLSLFSFGDKEDSKILKNTSKSLNISITDIITFIIFVCSILLSIVVLGYFPILLSFYILPSYNIFIKRLIICLIKILFITIIFLSIKFIPKIKQLYKFNYACNNVQKNNNQLNFLTYFFKSFLLNTIIISILGFTTNHWYFIFVNLAISLFVFSINYEILFVCQKINWLNKIFAPLDWLVLESSSQLEQKCVNILLSELALSNSKRDKMNTITTEEINFSEAYISAKEILEKNNKFEKSDLDFIFCEVLNKNRAEVKLTKTISAENYKKILDVCQKRAKGQPITKIFGHANFYGFDFKVTNDVLSPRMDTEVLVEQILNKSKDGDKVLDIGTGSGAIAITLCKMKKLKVTAVDISENALKVAKFNANKLNANVKFIKSDLFSDLSKLAKFDIIVSNPPYIPTSDINTLDEEVKNYDPILALDGGESGYDFYEKIIEQAPKFLNKNGQIFFEVGIGQAKEIKKFLQKDFKDIIIVKDLNKIDRVVCATLNK